MSNDPKLSPTSGEEATTVGNYFVANYPPFSFWKGEHVPALHQRLQEPPGPGPDGAEAPPFGLYVHIPFCRKRCDFCYFRVYTDKDSTGVRRYLDAVLSEARHYGQHALTSSARPPQFLYFGGGTPSYLSVDQLRYLFDGLQEVWSWDGVEEITFECEPGTLQEKKIHFLREAGITRLSLGVENFDPQILEWNNRAHRAKEIDRAYGFARDAGFPQINIDLIAGMVGETDDNWRTCIERTLEMAPESVTIYQMEVPYNTTIYKRMKDGGKEVAPVADWATKRRWVDEAYAELERHGYEVGSAYTAKKKADGDNEPVRFLYRDGLWHGADLLGLGVSSFSHLGGHHAQNQHDFDPYIEAVEAGALPLHRALPLGADDKLIREFVLQLKLGTLGTQYFRDKFGVDVMERFGDTLRQYERDGHLTIDGDSIRLHRSGLLQVDRLLHGFFRPEHRAARYA